MTEQSDAWQTSWAREADKVKGLAENNAHLRAALVKAEDECSTWRQRAEEAEEVAGEAERRADKDVRDLHAQLYSALVKAQADLWVAERTVREQRKALERVERLADRYESMNRGTVAEFIRVAISPPTPVALASLAPDTEGEGP